MIFTCSFSFFIAFHTQGFESASLYFDPDPAFQFNAEPDTPFHFNTDPDLAFHFNKDPAPQQGDGNLRPLAYGPSRPPFEPRKLLNFGSIADPDPALYSNAYPDLHTNTASKKN
jgi:hypothetical protein